MAGRGAQSKNLEYDVALSFAGCDRAKAKAVAERLKGLNIRVFYDEDQKNELWGEHGTAEFGEIYSRRSRFVVVFVSKDYTTREWTRHELSHVRARALKEQGAYLLPVQVEAGITLEGVATDMIYLSWEKEGEEGLLRAIYAKLRKGRISSKPSPPHTSSPPGPPAALPTHRPRAIQTSGWIVMCDIVQFSEKFEDEQVACVDLLHRIVEEQLADLRRRSTLHGPHYLNCTGDGFILVFPTGQIENPYATVLDLCAAVVRQTTEKRAGLLVRFGVHTGEYRSDVMVFGGSHVIGRGPNHCARVAAVGDAGNVVVSEEFARACQGSTGAASFSPPLTEEPIFVAIKHNRQAAVRLYVADGLSHTPPRRFQLIREIDVKIIATLKALESAFADLLKKLVPYAKLRLRLSIFLPDGQGGEWLSCKRYRVKNGQEEAGSATRYRIQPSEKAEGALGLAYILHRTLIIRNLPDPRTSPQKYTEAWLNHQVDGHGLNLTVQHIWKDNALQQKKWNRLPQALIAVPFSTFDGGWGVLCADTRHPLTKVPQAKFDAIRRLMEERVGTALASLILARRLV